MRKRLLGFTLGFVFTFAALVVGILLFTIATTPDQFNVLFVGSDQRGTERARSDVMFIVSMPKDPEVQPYFLTIPRDTFVDHEEYGLQKMTHFYALGDRPDDGKVLGNIDLTKAEIEKLLGIEVDATVEVTFQSFEEIIDTLGGAILDDGTQLSGQDALAIVRDRFTDGRSDFDRQTDARHILRSLLTKVKDPAVVKAMTAYFRDSDIARLQYEKKPLVRFLAAAGVERGGKIQIGEMEEDALPGYGERIYTPNFGKELYYWIADEEEIARIREEHFE